MEDCIEKIKEFEKAYYNNEYHGTGDEAFVIKEGIVPIMVSAPHSIKQYRNGQVKKADVYTGGIAEYLHMVTQCHMICSRAFTETDPNYDIPAKNQYQKALKQYIYKNDIKFLIDIHGASKEKEYAVEMGTAPRHIVGPKIIYDEDPSLHEHKYISRMIEMIMERHFSGLDNNHQEIWKNKVFDAGRHNTVTRYISDITDAACIQLEINGLYRNPDNKKEFMSLIDALIEIISFLSLHQWDEVA